MGIKVIDLSGAPQDMAWVQAHYGLQIVEPDPKPDSYYQVTVLQEREGPIACYLSLSDEKGLPVAGERVAYYWPDAPLNPDAGWLGRCQVHVTDGYGRAEHDVGHGEEYAPPAQGPAGWWVYGEGMSQMIQGFGWLYHTEHRHLDITMKKIGGTPPDDGDVAAAIRYAGDKIAQALQMGFRIEVVLVQE